MKNNVSVILPVSKSKNEFKRCLISILKNMDSGIEIELIVIFNNLKDDDVESYKLSMKEIINEYFKSGVPRSFSLQVRNANLVENGNVVRNIGRNIATKDFVAYIDCDDEYDANHLISSIAAIENIDNSFCYSAPIISNGHELIKKKSRQIKSDELPIDFLCGFKGGYAQTTSLVIKNSLSKHVSWNESLKRHQDFDYFISLCRNGTPVYKDGRTTIIHWEKGISRNIDHESMICFYLLHVGEAKFLTKVRLFYKSLIVCVRLRCLNKLKSYFFAIFFQGNSMNAH